MNYVYNTIHKGDPEGWNRKMREVYEDACKRFYATIIPFNYIAITILDDALDSIEERGLMRHEVKRLAKAIEKKKVVFRSSLKQAMARSDGLAVNRFLLMQNMSIELYRIIEHDIFLLSMSVKSVMDRMRLEDTRFKTGIVMADTFLNFSCQLFEEFFRAYKERTMADFSHSFTLGKLDGILTDFKRISMIICPDAAGIDFNGDRNCETAFSVINHKIADGDAINTAGERAMMEDEVFRTYLDDRDREDAEQILREKYKVSKAKHG